MSTNETVNRDDVISLTAEDIATGSRHSERSQTKRPAARASRTKAQGGGRRYMVLASGPDDVAAVDVHSGAMARLRVAPFAAHGHGLEPFDLIEANLSADPERDDLAHPEAVSITGFPEVIGSAPKRQARRRLRAVLAPNERHLLGFAGPAAPYWEFRGMRPSLALVAPALGPLLFRRKTDGTAWARFGWSRSDNWLPVEDERAVSCLWAAGSDKLAGKDLAAAIGFRPRYLLVALTPPRSGHCYKTIVAILPRP